jgi:hypothetical protein
MVFGMARILRERVAKDNSLPLPKRKLRLWPVGGSLPELIAVHFRANAASNLTTT